MIVIDTSAWIHILSGRERAWSRWFQQNLWKQHLALADLTLCEILQGLRDDAIALETEQYLRGFQVLSVVGADSAAAAAANYRLLRRRGITVRNSIDCMIATYCIRHGHTLLHHDRDFDPFEVHLGLRVVRP